MSILPGRTIHPAVAAAVGAAVLLTGAHPAVPFAGPAALGAQEAAESRAPQAREVPDITGSTVLLARDAARLELELASGDTHTVELNSGTVLIDGARRGSYETGGAFERAWRDLLRNPDLGETEQLGGRLAAWEPPADAAGASGLSAVLGAFDRYDPSITAAETDALAADARPAGPAADGQVTIVPRAGSLERLGERLRELNETLGRISGEEFGLEGDFSLVVHDDYRIGDEATIEGDVALLGGTLTVDGEIEGDVLVLGGRLQLEPGSLVMGDVRSVGGEVETTGATVTGEILSLSLAEASAATRATDARVDRRADRSGEWDHDERRDRGFFGSIAHNVSRTIGDVVGTIVWIVGLTLLGAGLVYFAPGRLEAIAAEARADVLRSFGVGLAGQLLFFPILLLLVVLIVTWLVVPFYVLAVAVAVPAGYLAVARGLGEVVVDRRYELFERFNLNRQNTYYYVLNGVIVLLAPFAIAAVLQLFGGVLGFLRGLTLFLAIVLTWAAATTGFGAVILTRGGGLARNFPSFRRKRSVPLDDLRRTGPPPDDPTAGSDGMEEGDESGDERTGGDDDA
jgi:cytoskeletal protein CcmA (bactofilin family)